MVTLVSGKFTISTSDSITHFFLLHLEGTVICTRTQHLTHCWIYIIVYVWQWRQRRSHSPGFGMLNFQLLANSLIKKFSLHLELERLGDWSGAGSGSFGE